MSELSIFGMRIVACDAASTHTMDGGAGEDGDGNGGDIIQPLFSDLDIGARIWETPLTPRRISDAVAEARAKEVGK